MAIQMTSTTHIAYCFAPVAGYSAFGSYTGNGSTDGPFVHLGFRPAFLLIKNTASTVNWRLHDSARDDIKCLEKTFVSQTPMELSQFLPQIN